MEVTAPRAMPGLVRAVVWMAAAAAIGAGTYRGYQWYRAAQAAAAPPQFFTVPAAMGSVDDTVSGTGTIQPAATQNVSPQVGGTIARIDVAVGQSVHAGDPVLELADTQGLGQQVAAAQAALDDAQRRLEQLLQPAAATDPRTISRDQLQLQSAQVALQRAQATLAKDQAAAAATAVTTPVAGTVQSVGVVAGQQVSAGTPIATIQPAGAPTVSVAVPQGDLPYLPVGTAATISIPSIAATVTGKVTAVGAVSTGATGSGGQAASGGRSGSGGAAGSASTSLITLTVTPDTEIKNAPNNATALVSFTPSGDPPAGHTWSESGAVTFPAPITVAAQQSGTVSDLAAPGAAVTAGQRIATVTNTATAITIQQDEYAVQQAQLSLQQAQLTLDQAEHPAPATAQAIAAQRLAVASAQQELELRQAALNRLTVRAPMDGTVTAVNVQVGQQVSTGTVAVKLQSSNALQAVVLVDELGVAKLKVGQPAKVSMAAFPNQQFQGHVADIGLDGQTQAGVTSYPVTIQLSDVSGVRTGMNVSAVITVQHLDNVLRVPSWAVRIFGQGQGVVMVPRNGHPSPVTVRVGLRGPQWTQILSGIEAGTPVVAGQVQSTSQTGAFGFRGGFGGGLGGPRGGGGGPRIVAVAGRGD